MTDLRKAAEMALKFCEDIGDLGGPYPYVNETAVVSDSRKVLQALRQALAQPEQEQYVTKVVAVHEDGTYTTERIPLPKREWVGLTDEELKPLCHEWQIIYGGYVRPFAETIEAKLKEKNT